MPAHERFEIGQDHLEPLVGRDQVLGRHPGHRLRPDVAVPDARSDQEPRQARVDDQQARAAAAREGAAPPVAGIGHEGRGGIAHVPRQVGDPRSEKQKAAIEALDQMRHPLVVDERDALRPEPTTPDHLTRTYGRSRPFPAYSVPTPTWERRRSTR